jgi:hypothetical protein
MRKILIWPLDSTNHISFKVPIALPVDPIIFKYLFYLFILVNFCYWYISMTKIELNFYHSQNLYCKYMAT